MEPKKPTTLIKPRKMRNRSNLRKKSVTQDDNEKVVIQKPSSSTRKKDPSIQSTKQDKPKENDIIEKFSSRRQLREGDQLATRSNEEHGTLVKQKAKGDPHRTGIGPIKAHKSIRFSAPIDYLTIGICKDYRLTGSCAWGDTCIYAHIREDYKSGWELDKEWEEEQRKKKLGIVDSDSDSEDDKDTLPMTCMICEQAFTDPVVTKCKHYFCEKCALDHYQKDKKCAVCGAPTDGIFNTAKEILKKLKASKDVQPQKEETGENKREYTSGWGIVADFNDIQRKGSTAW